MCNFQIVQNDKYSAVFVNEQETVPLEIVPLGVYQSAGDAVQELCKYTYLFEDSIKYEILHWEFREAKDTYSKYLIKNVLEQQKALHHLLKE